MRSERQALYRELLAALRRKYNPRDPVEVVALWERDGCYWIAYRNRFYGDEVHAYSRGEHGDRDADLWVSLLPEPGPPGTLDPATGIHWDMPIPTEPVPDFVARAVADALSRPWSPAPNGESLPLPAMDARL